VETQKCVALIDKKIEKILCIDPLTRESFGSTKNNRCCQQLLNIMSIKIILDGLKIIDNIEFIILEYIFDYISD
jgi:hypothetical protein